MKLKIDKQASALYFRLNENAIVESENTQQDVIFDFDKDHQVVGIELLNLNSHIGQEKISILQLEIV